MRIRDELEGVLRAWHRYEIARGGPAVIDFDCFPSGPTGDDVEDRLAVHNRLNALLDASADDPHLQKQIVAHLTYLAALLGERLDLNTYVERTQGCKAVGWSNEYISQRGELARQSLETLGLSWNTDTERNLEELEKPLAAHEAPDAIREAADHFEPSIRQATGSEANYRLTIETANIDAYWSYWLDGAGSDVRLRLNLHTARFTEVRARQFALHEVLGHGLQSASFSAQCEQKEVPWVRLLSVHAPTQVLLEGLAQAWPLFVAASDGTLIARVRLDHYLQLVRAQLHLAINARVSIDNCVSYARTRVPFWSDQTIADTLSDRGRDPLLRSYLWSYPAGLDWFAALADAGAAVAGEVLYAAYRQPLTPLQLQALWPDGPTIGGTASSLRLRQPPLS
ncbi:hypothetical protein J5X84_42110 [Streptosporangiaceae bacterium NEAU-GS5]|nr:hypothetical protein [Streptosporangiaceae bacterium NEAU-GS5]